MNLLNPEDPAGPGETDDPEPERLTPEGRRVGAITGRPLRPIDPAYTPRLMDALRGTRPWVLVIAVVIFIFTGLTVLGGLLQLALLSGGGGGAALLSFMVSAAMSIVYASCGFQLLRYARHIRGFLGSGAPRLLEEALEAQSSFWRLVGIVLIVTVVLYALLLGCVVLAFSIGR